MYHATYPLWTDVPELTKLQNYAKNNKKRSKAGVKIENMLQLKTFMMPLIMPATLSALTEATTAVLALAGGGSSSSAMTYKSSQTMMYVPFEPRYEVEGACFTGPRQIQWIGQLAEKPLQFVLHADGKHKLHHGQWILMSIGTHILVWDEHHKKLSTKFIPLMYIFCKQHESLGACTMLTDAVQFTWCATPTRLPSPGLL